MILPLQKSKSKWDMGPGVSSFHFDPQFPHLQSRHGVLSNEGAGRKLAESPGAGVFATTEWESLARESQCALEAQGHPAPLFSNWGSLEDSLPLVP